jgi:hypothetical protein
MRRIFDLRLTEQISIQRGLVPEGDVLLEWPESQPYIGDDNTVLVNSGPLYKETGDAAVLISERHTTARKGEDAKTKADRTPDDTPGSPPDSGEWRG